MLKADVPLVPGVALGQMATHSIDWWLSAEDLPVADNRVMLSREGQIELHVTDTYHEHFDRLVKSWTHKLKSVDDKTHFVPTSLYLQKTVPLKGVAHQCGTCASGEDRTTSVLDLNCRAHEVDNLYVVDGSFFCSVGAVNPSLTMPLMLCGWPIIFWNDSTEVAPIMLKPPPANLEANLWKQGLPWAADEPRHLIEFEIRRLPPANLILPESVF